MLSGSLQVTLRNRAEVMPALQRRCTCSQWVCGCAGFLAVSLELSEHCAEGANEILHGETAPTPEPVTGIHQGPAHHRQDGFNVIMLTKERLRLLRPRCQRCWLQVRASKNSYQRVRHPHRRRARRGCSVRGARRSFSRSRKRSVRLRKLKLVC